MSCNKVLVWLKPDYIGDAVWSLPLVDVLAKQGEAVTVCANPSLKAVFDGRSVSWELPSPLPTGIGPFRWALKLRSRGYRTVYLANRSFRSALLARLSGIPNRIGHKTEGRSLLLTTAVGYDPKKNFGESLLDLARASGLEAPFSWPVIRVDAPAKNVLCIQPGARHPWKRPPWPSVLKALNDLPHSVPLVLVGGQSEKEACKAFASQLNGGATIMAGRHTLRETIDLLAGSLGLIAGDTGLVHLAAAAGTPTVAFLQPRLVGKWAWDHPNHATLSLSAEPSAIVGHLAKFLTPAAEPK